MPQNDIAEGDQPLLRTNGLVLVSNTPKGLSDLLTLPAVHPGANTWTAPQSSCEFRTTHLTLFPSIL